MKVIPTGKVLGARVEDLDLATDLGPSQVDDLMVLLATHGVLEFPRQTLSTRQLKRFSEKFGELYLSPGGRAQAAGFPEVMILSNMLEEGKAVGLSDAGQAWHTDMAYSNIIALTNVLYGTTIPQRDGRPLGNTELRNMHKVYEDLPADIKQRLEGKTISHDFNKFWELMRERPGSPRAPLSAEERAQRPPAVHAAALTHPITGRTVLYANPGYAVAINELPADESDQLLDYLFEFQSRPEYLYTYSWNKDSVLMWDNIGTTHNAVADYTRDEHRYIQRCQVMATRFYGEAGTRAPRMFARQQA
jgi:taurine dioxygenase